MKFKKRAVIPPLVIVLFILLAVLASMARKPPEMRQQQKPAVMVEVLKAEPVDKTFMVESQGTVKPKFSTNLVAEVSGQIIDVADQYVAGGFFKKGDMLVQIDPSDYQAAVQQAKADLLQAQAALEEEKARGKVAKEEWASIQEGKIPELGLRKPQLASAVANVESAQARLAQAKRDLERTTIRAPFAGVLKSKVADLGQYVSTGTQVGMLLGTDIAEVRVPLSDQNMAFIRNPSDIEDDQYPPVKLTSVVAGEPRQWMGHLVRTEGVIDENSRVIYGVVQVKDPYSLDKANHSEVLRFGRFVQAEIEGVRAHDVYEIPSYALTHDGGVWVVTDERTLQKKSVTVVRNEDNLSLVSDGLNPGDRVMLTQLEDPLPGMDVRLPGDPLPEQMETAAKTDEQATEKSGG
ncbi:efflux RND transporter periplasmic adaptor subunit [Idiomarina tyrosinivorans]|uniref:Efflux RND transporter periplasmic adaptor subunit n=1 Tax=Idiomarina tyrosinivorans TaxID=1445662 RepID=A0A432ZLV7_9GAMM|nr:efflux RND transporter periplasmic adaptor subunit [Idiomarina tyrosinivorans]RUO78910.1 efflux RND transporter periplasmic adaptor subunit [Idiomarina tyrosinivorans]